jgi:WD40 repeat protein
MNVPDPELITGPDTTEGETAATAPARFDYDAFISYRRVDGADVALWLRRALEGYRLPAELGRGRAPLRCYLDTIYAVALDDFWDLNIAPALARSRCLILIATTACLEPGRNGEPSWVERELQAFRSKAAGPIYVARGNGELSDPIPEGIPERTHRVDLRAAAHPFSRWRQRQHLSEELLSLVAPLYEVPANNMPLLRQEERRRAAAQRRNRIALTLGLSAGFASLSVYAHSAVKSAERERLGADAARAAEIAGQPGRGNEALALALRTYARAIDMSEVAEGTSMGLAASLAVPISRPLTGHSAQVTAAAVASDGTYVVTSDKSGVAIVWNTGTGTIKTKLIGHKDGLTGAHLVSLQSGPGVVTVDGQGTIRAWTIDGKQLASVSAPCRILRTETNEPAHRLLARCESGNLLEWKLNEAPALGASTSYPVLGAVDAHYSGDGRFVIAGANDGSTSTWTTTKHERVAVWSTPGVSVVAISHDGVMGASGTLESSIYFLDGPSSPVLTAPSAPGSNLRFLAYSFDGQLLISADDRTVKQWDPRTHREGWIDTRHGSTILAMNISPDGKLVVTSGRDNVYVRDAFSDRFVATLSGHAGLCYDAVFTPDSRHVLTVNGDHTARLWTLPSPLGATDLIGHRDEVNSAQFSHDGTRVVTASDDGTVMVWDAGSGTPLRTLRGNAAAASGATFSVNDSRIVTAGQDGWARVYDASNGQAVLSLQHGAPVNWAALDGEGTNVATAGDDGRTLLWNTENGKKVELESHPDHPIQFVSYAQSGRWLVTAGDDQQARIWDARSRQLVGTLTGHDGSVMSASFSRDETRIATASLDGTARVWDVRDHVKPIQVVRPGTDGVRVMSAALSPDGRQLATASADGRVEVWDAATGAPLLVLQTGGKAVQRVEFSPDGQAVLIASNDKSARVYPSNPSGLLSLGCARATGLPTWPELSGTCTSTSTGSHGLITTR